MYFAKFGSLITSLSACCGTGGAVESQPAAAWLRETDRDRQTDRQKRQTEREPTREARERTFSNIMIKTLSKYLPGAESAEAPPTSTAQVVARMESIGAILGVGGGEHSHAGTDRPHHACHRPRRRWQPGTGRRTRDPGVRRRETASTDAPAPLGTRGDVGTHPLPSRGRREGPGRRGPARSAHSCAVGLVLRRKACATGLTTLPPSSPRTCPPTAPRLGTSTALPRG